MTAFRDVRRRAGRGGARPARRGPRARRSASAGGSASTPTSRSCRTPNGGFSTPSGKCELYSERLAGLGHGSAAGVHAGARESGRRSRAGRPLPAGAPDRQGCSPLPELELCQRRSRAQGREDADARPASRRRRDPRHRRRRQRARVQRARLDHASRAGGGQGPIRASCRCRRDGGRRSRRPVHRRTRSRPTGSPTWAAEATSTVRWCRWNALRRPHRSITQLPGNRSTTLGKEPKSCAWCTSLRTRR